MSSYQISIVIGNVGRDAEMRYTPSGKAVTEFSVAANRKYTKSDGSKGEETTWFRVVVWGKQAETCNQYVKKGDRVLVQGRLNPDPDTGGPRVWNKQDGSPAASFELTAEAVRFLGSSQSSSQKENSVDEDPF